jgi:hypothetical protein
MWRKSEMKKNERRMSDDDGSERVWVKHERRGEGMIRISNGMLRCSHRPLIEMHKDTDWARARESDSDVMEL